MEVSIKYGICDELEDYFTSIGLRKPYTLVDKYCNNMVEENYNDGLDEDGLIDGMSSYTGRIIGIKIK